MNSHLGDAVRQHRQRRGLSQGELAKLSGYSPAFICNIERGKYRFTSPEALARISRALKIQPDELYKAAGVIKTTKSNYRKVPKTPQEIIAELETSMPIAIPVVADIHAGPSDALDYVYWARSSPVKRNLKALRVKGFCMSPKIEEGDIIIIDPDASPVKGKDIVVCHDDGQIWLKIYGQHGDCDIYGVVIGINRRL